MNRGDIQNQAKYAPVYNRLTSLMFHAPRYSIEGITRLARDAGVTHTALGYLIRGIRHPSYLVALRVVSALEQALGVPLDLREVIREDPHFPTPYPCALVGCSGCLPPWYYGDGDTLLPEFAHAKPGQWLAPIQSTEFHP